MHGETLKLRQKNFAVCTAFVQFISIGRLLFQQRDVFPLNRRPTTWLMRVTQMRQFYSSVLRNPIRPHLLIRFYNVCSRERWVVSREVILSRIQLH